MIETDSVMVVIACCTNRPNGLNHDQPVGCLHARPLQTVIENRILISHEIQSCRMIHHSNADVPGVLVGQQRIRVVDGPDENAV